MSHEQHLSMNWIIVLSALEQETIGSADIQRKLEKAGFVVSLSHMSTTMGRLTQRKYVTKLEPLKKSTSYPVSPYKITEAGLRELQKTRDCMLKLWK